MYEIDSNVKFQAAKKGRHSKVMELPFDKLAIDQSFHVPAEKDRNKQSIKLSAWCQLAGKRLNRRFALRTVDSDDPRGPGIRIWRVENAPKSLDALFASTDVKPVAVQAQSKKGAAKSVSKPASAKAAETSRQGSRRARKAAESRSWQPRA